MITGWYQNNLWDQDRVTPVMAKPEAPGPIWVIRHKDGTYYCRDHFHERSDWLPLSRIGTEAPSSWGTPTVTLHTYRSPKDAPRFPDATVVKW